MLLAEFTISPKKIQTNTVHGKKAWLSCPVVHDEDKKVNTTRMHQISLTFLLLHEAVTHKLCVDPRQLTVASNGTLIRERIRKRKYL